MKLIRPTAALLAAALLFGAAGAIMAGSWTAGGNDTVAAADRKAEGAARMGGRAIDRAAQGLAGSARLIGDRAPAAALPAPGGTAGSIAVPVKAAPAQSVPVDTAPTRAAPRNAAPANSGVPAYRRKELPAAKKTVVAGAAWSNRAA
jgi:hypothetical protein